MSHRPGNSTVRWSLLFGGIAFLQGLADPSDGLFSQPTLSLLGRRGETIQGTIDFAAIVTLPWAIKPVFGMISDTLPVFGSRRKAYLILSAITALVGFLNVHASLADPGHPRPILGWLILATAGIAFSDVVSDALMIETGQVRGLTGRFQSIQWACTYASTIAVGYLGGWFSEHRAEKAAVTACVVITALLVVASLFFVEEPDRGKSRASTARQIGKDLAEIVRIPGLWSVAGFLFLWNFNPFSSQVLRSYMTGPLALNEGFYGTTQSLFAMACVVASLGYGLYCRRVSMRWLVHASIVLGVIQTTAYWGLIGQKSAVAVTIIAGLTYMTASLIQLDLAARVCPPEVAGTAFALLMAVENLATTGSLWVGGRLYDGSGAVLGYDIAYAALVGVGAGTTAACWLLVPFLPEGLLREAEGYPVHRR